MTTKKQFTDLLTEIEPSTSTVDACSSAHRTLRERLRTDDKFSAFHADTFLSGSYRRDTAIRPRRVDGTLQRPDVDIIVVTNHTQDDAPKVVLGALHQALKDCGYTNLTVNRRSINVKLVGVDMDVVPVIEDGDAYRIPDVELETWLPTNPPGHTNWTIEVNALNGLRFKPLVKLVKWWRRENLADLKRPKGFILETMVAKHMSSTEESYGTLFVEFLEAVRDNYGLHVLLGQVPFIEDPAVPGNNVFSNVTSSEFKTFYDKASKHAALAREAMNEKDADTALEKWREVFGPCFPTANGSAKAGLVLPAIAGAGLSFPPTPVRPNTPSGFA